MTESIRILIIDDDPGIRDTYQAILSPPADSGLMAEGASLFGGDEKAYHTSRFFGPYELCLACDGEEGIQYVNDTLTRDVQPFCMAFVDMKMPGLSGADTVKRIWTLDEDIRMVIVTAFSEFTPADIVRQTGREDLFYLRKPFNPEEIKQFARVLSNEWLFDKERKQMANNLADMNRDLQEKVEEQAAIIVKAEKMASIGILAAGVAHEINTPIVHVGDHLSTMKTYVQTLWELLKTYGHLEETLEQGSPDRCKVLLEKIRAFKQTNQIDFIQKDMVDLLSESLAGTDRIKTVIRDLRTFSQVDKDEFRTIDINESIETILDTLAGDLKGKAVVEKNFSDLPRVYCFARKIDQVFLNILMNAIQAIEDQGVIRIDTRLIHQGRRNEDRYVEIAFSDTGCGIDPQDLSRLFDPFFTTKPAGQGAGLGLSIVYDIITFHKGDIRVDSRPGEGATVTIKLPVKKALNVSRV